MQHTTNTNTRRILGQHATNSTVSIFIPSTLNAFIGDAKYTSVAPCYLREKLLKHTIERFVQLFGGATVTQGKGYWFDQMVSLTVSEDVDIVESFAGTLTLSDVFEIKEIAETVKRVLGQDAVTVKINGKVWFV